MCRCVETIVRTVPQMVSFETENQLYEIKGLQILQVSLARMHKIRLLRVNRKEMITITFRALTSPQRRQRSHTL